LLGKFGVTREIKNITLFFLISFLKRCVKAADAEKYQFINWNASAPPFHVQHGEGKKHTTRLAFNPPLFVRKKEKRRKKSVDQSNCLYFQ